MRNLRLTLGVLALASLSLYAFTGITVWVPLAPSDGFWRMWLLFAIHVFGIMAGVIALAEDAS